jgi:hypothetical protein
MTDIAAPIEGAKVDNRQPGILRLIITRLDRRTILRGDGSFSFTAEVSGNDIVVHRVTATWFGGPDDPSDNGLTASGVSTRANPDIRGCALPMDLRPIRRSTGRRPRSGRAARATRPRASASHRQE